jgi:hypothetical protein
MTRENNEKQRKTRKRKENDRYALETKRLIFYKKNTRGGA